MLEPRSHKDRRITLLERYGQRLGHIVECHRVEAALMVAKRDAERAAGDARRAMVKAQTSDRTKSEFLANMSHELRTPLNAILGFSEIMKKEMLGPLGTEQYRQYVEDIHESGRYLLDVISDILDISRIEAGNLELAESEIKLKDIIGKSVRLVQDRARSAGVSLCTEMNDPPPLLWGDERLIKQCLVNLLSNAVKFTPEGGRVSVCVRRSKCGGLDLAVTDTGIGIAEEDIDKVLSPFGQVDSAYSANYEGTGLGLPITKALIELHGGALLLDSAPGAGATVTLSFPRERVLDTRD